MRPLPPTRRSTALKRYFAAAKPRDAAWAVYFLAGGKPRQVVPTAVLRALACQRAGIDDWLFDASYQAVGDFAETVAHILPPPERQSDLGLADWIETRLLPLRGADPDVQAERIASWWDELDTAGRFLLNKLIGGAFRVGVSKLLVQRALAEGAGIDAKLVARRMMGYTDGTATPSAERYRDLTANADVGPKDLGQPYPFFLAHQLDIPLADFEAKLARRPTGSSNGSTTGYARRSSSVAARSGSGRAARNSSPNDFRKSSPAPCRCPTARCWTAKSSCGKTARSRRSTCCSGASGARR